MMMMMMMMMMLIMIKLLFPPSFLSFLADGHKQATMGKPQLFASIAVVVVAIALNRWQSSGLDGDLTVITNNRDLENTLRSFKRELGSDLDPYRGHLYRVLTYALHFLHGEFHVLASPSPECIGSR